MSGTSAENQGHLMVRNNISPLRMHYWLFNEKQGPMTLTYLTYFSPFLHFHLTLTTSGILTNGKIKLTVQTNHMYQFQNMELMSYLPQS